MKTDYKKFIEETASHLTKRIELFRGTLKNLLKTDPDYFEKQCGRIDGLRYARAILWDALKEECDAQ